MAEPQEDFGWIDLLELGNNILNHLCLIRQQSLSHIDTKKKKKKTTFEEYFEVGSVKNAFHALIYLVLTKLNNWGIILVFYRLRLRNDKFK